MLSGFATPEGTTRYQNRFKGRVAEGHFLASQGLWMSSIGLGTYLGEPDADTDSRYRDAILQARELGCNVLDTAINYRFQRSERAIGAALAQACSSGTAKRDEMVIASKCGFLTFDDAIPADQRRYFRETYLKPGILAPADLVQGMHCMAPNYIADQIDRSRNNLGLECIDIYYLHNPETQLEEIDMAAFEDRLRLAFETMEKAVALGKIRMFGTATWSGYRLPPSAPNYLGLERILEIAREVGGGHHHFKVIQLPYNLYMQEAFAQANQVVGGRAQSPLAAAQSLGLTVMCSASLLQSRLAGNLPATMRQRLAGLSTDAQRAIQFVRSTPGVTVALVGMSRTEHVEENLLAAKQAPLTRNQFMQMFS